MSRVSEALTRAQGGALPGEPGLEAEFAAALPSERAAELWPTERATARPRREQLSPDTGGEAAARHVAPKTTFDALARTKVAKLVLNAELEPTSVEQYRRLGARLHLGQAQQGTKVVMVTSALVGEGKTVTATNLALTLSESYKKRVLLIDADLRRPGVHELFGIPNFTGLNDGIRSGEERQVPVVRVTDHLSVLTAGRPDADPMSVLSSDRMRRVVSDAAAAFEWVIIDTPPVALLSDAHLLATLVDTVVLVVRAGVTPLQAIQTATLVVGRDKIMGVVLNCADKPPRSRYRYYAHDEAVAAGG